MLIFVSVWFSSRIFEFLELAKGLILGLHKINPRFPRRIINERNVIDIVSEGTYQINNPFRSMLLAWKSSLGMIMECTTLEH
jgi:hypothetical protein